MTPHRRRLLRRSLLVAIGVLYVVSIPWYRAPDPRSATWLGMPEWATVAVLCYVMIALCNALAWLLTDVPDEPES